MTAKTQAERIGALRALRLPHSLRLTLPAAALFGAAMGLFAIIQFATPGLAGTDGYYHIQMAHLMRQQGLKPRFVWLPMTILNPASYYDHHFLYHVYLALFVPPNATPEALVYGAKVASVVLPALACLAIGWMLRGQGVPGAWLWALGLFAVSDAFLYRMSMPRAQSASLLVLALGLHWLLNRRGWLLLPLGFLYVWLYDGFPLLLVLAAACVAATGATERRLEWKPLAAAGVGIALGLLINPYFPQNLTFIASHLLPKIGEMSTRVGNEWYPYETWTLVENSAGALAACVLAVLALGWNRERIDRPTLTALLLVVFFGLLVFKSRRFIEYFPAFALILAALSVSRLPEVHSLQGRRRWLAAGLALAVAVPLGVRTVIRATEALERSKPPDLYAEAATWLALNSPPGSLVFQTDWDDFPRLFFYNTTNVYTIGLDTTYMQLYDPDLYEEWVDITQGRVDEPGQVIASRFGAAYVFSDRKHDEFLEEARNDSHLKEVYRDENAVIFEVLD